MRRAPLLAWLALTVYGLWLFALQGMLASPRLLGAWTPDLGLVLLLSLGAGLRPSRLRIAACLVALARAGVGADPPAALLAGYLGVAGVSGTLRSGLEIDHPLPRTILAGACAWILARFWIATRSIALAAGPGAHALDGIRAWPGAVATAAAALLLAPVLPKLPGLAALRRRQA